MNGETSNWIPSNRIRVAFGIAFVFVAAAMIGAVWSPFVLILLVPALGAASAGLVMLWIRRQLSARGGGWEKRIHQRAVSHLALAR